MPAKKLFSALKERCGEKVVLSDRETPVPPEALEAGVTASDPVLYVEFRF